ncbi:hypothetical protein N7532_007697 [Penicillium argentinense]|uniref:Uncharacterized protein n=1 Tax=Penicillium argentinense TaxID=1131581 RepID=A0A9W9EVY5_9EURO|nr:uncharacterized protein N7532_007697 [Penicillium argentinense]KAJ5089013.1 hypothetical protein N7532_007697 [Penicillium argentinense]
MPRNDGQSYFLYGYGKKPAQLRLGHLCFGHYSEATDDSLWYFPGEDLDAAGLAKCADVFNIDNQIFGTDPSIKISTDLNALDLITVGSSFSKSRAMFVYAKTGRKIELKEYVPIQKTILIKDSCKKTLERWLVVANPSLKTLFTSPKIWYLTGFYELEDTLSFSSTKSTFGARGGISAELLSLLGAPAGASAAAETAKSQFQSVQIKEPLVWAARYQLLDAKYLHFKKGEPKPGKLVELGRKALYSDGTVRGPGDVANYAELSLLESETDLNTEGPPTESDEYWKAIKKAQHKWEKREDSRKSPI